MSSLVLDASAALALLRSEATATEVRRRIHDAVRDNQALLVPPLFWLEVTNVLAMRYRYPPAAIVEAVYELEQLGLRTVSVGRPGVLGVIDAIARTSLTSYDAEYLVLSESIDARLLTADARLAAAAPGRAILVGGGPELAEERAGHVSGAPWPSWHGAVAYLADLRSRS